MKKIYAAMYSVMAAAAVVAAGYFSPPVQDYLRQRKIDHYTTILDQAESLIRGDDNRIWRSFPTNKFYEARDLADTVRKELAGNPDPSFAVIHDHANKYFQIADEAIEFHGKPRITIIRASEMGEPL